MTFAALVIMKFRRTPGAQTLIHDKVVTPAGQDIGRIEELMIDVTTGRVAYAVLSFGGFLGINNKLFALPWSAVTVDEAKQRFLVNVSKEQLDKMPGFDKSHWPDLGDLEDATGVYWSWGGTPSWAGASPEAATEAPRHRRREQDARGQRLSARAARRGDRREALHALVALEVHRAVGIGDHRRLARPG